MCNKEIKFGLFYKWAREQGTDFIATGHYARREGDHVYIAKDTNKDQTYFLWTLTPEIIAHTLFPIGEYTKPEVRELARKFKLPVAEKKDSQGVCFIGEGNMADFLRDEIKTRRGEIKTSSGKKVGEHDGIELFTIGQRHGIGTRGGTAPMYVAKKDQETSTLVVAESADDPILYQKELRFKDTNWTWKPGFQVSESSFGCEARIRYRAPLAKCTVFLDVRRLGSGKVIFEKPQRAIAPGQSVVFYKDNPFDHAHGKQLLGGGVIE
jgi:tRNA-specific 2-thiouridylase